MRPDPPLPILAEMVIRNLVVVLDGHCCCGSSNTQGVGLSCLLLSLVGWAQISLHFVLVIFGDLDGKRPSQTDQ